MVSATALLGGKTRFAVLEALAEAKQPITAYQIAIKEGLDPAATYRCLTEFAELGVVESKMKERNQTCYSLSERIGQAAAEFLRSLKEKQTESSDLEKWISPKMQAERMGKLVKLGANRRKATGEKPAEEKTVSQLLSRRVTGELGALIKSSQIAFNEMFERKGDTFILKM